MPVNTRRAVNQVQPTDRRLKIGLISLGCAKNLVDAEVMLGVLVRDGYQITNAAAEADVLIVNTCAFIDAAQEESVDAILECAVVRERRHPDQGLVVAGCLPQRFRADLPALLPEVDGFMGIDQVADVGRIAAQAFARRTACLRQRGRDLGAAQSDRAAQGGAGPGAPGRGPMALAPSHAGNPVIEVHARPTFVPDFATPRFRLTPRHYAYVKIAEGCNHPCSFCVIPSMRGRHRSRAEADILAESRRLVQEGIKELILISQDSTYYGMDLLSGPGRSLASPERFQSARAVAGRRAPNLGRLLQRLNAIEGEFWIRVLYTHPAHWTRELIDVMAACEKVARYIDIPLQHIHSHMLERMHRETSRDYIEDLLRRMRRGLPGIALRTTFIVGFPGETERHFERLVEFVKWARFERLGVFTYSHEDGTRAAAMSHQVPLALKVRRKDRLMAVQRQISRELGRLRVGSCPRVLVEREAREEEKGAAIAAMVSLGQDTRRLAESISAGDPWCVARGEADAPETDGRVLVTRPLPMRAFSRVRVVGSTDYDLVAEPV